MNYTAKEIAETLDIGESTARAWAKDFKIPKRKGSKKIFSKEAFNMFVQIKTLKDENLDTVTIKEKLGQSVKESKNAKQNAQQPLNTDIADSIAQSIKTEIASEFQAAKQALSAEVKSEISANNVLSESYARATYKIGQLEQQVLQLQENTKLLPAPMEWANAQRDIQDLQKQNEALAAELEAKQAQLDDETAKQKAWAEMGVWARIIAAIRGQAP